jgi:hypothetical protein
MTSLLSILIFSDFSKITYIGEPLATANMLTLVRLFARMRSNMNCQGTSLNEALPASKCQTGVRPLVRVNSEMPLQI